MRELSRMCLEYTVVLYDCDCYFILCYEFRMSYIELFIFHMHLFIIHLLLSLCAVFLWPLALVLADATHVVKSNFHKQRWPF